MPASCKEKYIEIEARHIFQPIAMETLGVFSSSARQFLSIFGQRVSIGSGEARETCFSFRESRCCCSASMLSHSTTVCRR